MQTDRDPRIDPKVGDVVQGAYLRRVDYAERTALGLFPRMVWWHGPTKTYGSSCSLKQWRKWAKDARVVHAAD